jgi:hypothetical protein
MSHEKSTGSRAEVFHGTAKHTSGGLTKRDLLKNKHGRIVSRKKHTSARKEKRLLKHGYGTKKGSFGYVKKRGTKRHLHKSMAGGMTSLTPASLDGKSLDMSGFAPIQNDNQQLRATTVGGSRRSRSASRGRGRSASMAGGFLAPLAIL